VRAPVASSPFWARKYNTPPVVHLPATWPRTRAPAAHRNPETLHARARS